MSVEKGFATQPKLFGKWNYDEVKIQDPCFQNYIACTTTKSQVFVPHTAGRYQVKKFRKTQCPIVERLIGTLMFHGRNAGKKALCIKVVKNAFEIIHLVTGRNPLEVFVGAVQNAGPREDSTRIGTAGVVRKQAVDVAPMRRVNLAIYFIIKGCRESAFKSMRSIAETLADEIINAEKNNTQSSWAIRKKDEIEKVAKGNR
ncbi:40S ribosomal protein S5 (macronuclear) [Tetrahymena thermophila SB210]|uniref:40S ribosomal protein S5 n=3 Tax=Eukaryota TaxID=2759 RepID=Q22WU7_TETTS|nr:40S ribosomal protein S5 [Tetrahymena thermophila SB210]2XZN_G Chain G, Ribosomal Protein S7 Containing Protein [Tetrahymena thermophila]4BPN_G Chain G, 40s Ribosomal Protein Rps5e [Tetrahymena thermophila]4BPO_G Chain G, 40s Ribosomal Protein Rps5e [Tetrahymena thermophila]4BTS_AG Chain AG, 40S RIBOSOMAL PROTEIN RPS5E [Tetrahymena thermophila]4BTS_BG Chain BG, 40S RIBOSOMAL PROTEIN RPS5E [Tetrahymena thermophila]4BTS_CG Chain CG, 40S RIBOSOMAL PROTEIN RPS5E [Tetrahymena thermophila]4BTS_|eukprot:XP_001009990.1 40S ribosomal protein S5 [Tetrahymena thermophila SB210]